MSDVKPTVRAVARATGFSVATVSRVLNGSARVRETTRASVLEAAARLDYTPNASARALATRRTRTIGVVIPTIEGSIFAPYVRSLERTLAARGYAIVLATTYFDAERETGRALQLVGMGAEALVVSGTEHQPGLLETASRRGVPVVCTSVYDAHCPLPTIGYDNRALAAEALGHLCGLGHRRLAVLHGPRANNDRTRLRLAGAHDALPAGAELIEVESELNVAAGAAALARALAMPHRPSALLCLSDVLAMGVVFEATRLGLAVPGELSVMGFDDLDWAPTIEPPLTTMHLPVDEMGAAVADALVACLDERHDLRHACLPGRLVVRASTGPAPRS